MSRFDQPTQEPDYDRYDAKPLDAADEPQDDEPVDPVEHAMHALLVAIADVKRQLPHITDLARARTLKALVHEAWQQIDGVDLGMSLKIDTIMERHR